MCSILSVTSFPNVAFETVSMLVSLAMALSHAFFLSFFLRSSIGGVAYVTIYNSSATWAATIRLWGYKCMLVIFVFPQSTEF